MLMCQKIGVTRNIDWVATPTPVPNREAQEIAPKCERNPKPKTDNINSPGMTMNVPHPNETRNQIATTQRRPTCAGIE